MTRAHNNSATFSTPVFDQPRAEAAIRELLIAVGEDPDRHGLEDTPARVARAYKEMFAGLYTDPDTVLDTTFDEQHDELVLVKQIPLYSTCEHHLVAFHGVAHVGYIPGVDGRVTGLSKIARLVDLYAKRPQVQERLTAQIADALMRKLDPRGAIVVIEAEHLCMSMRGVRKPGATTTTSAVRGQFKVRRGITVRGAGSDLAEVSPSDVRVMGVVNVTDDSFSDGGLFLDRDRAVEHGLALAADGAAIVDVGGESTRPGATRIDPSVEIARVLPVIKELAGQGLTVSIDTMHADVARAALENGAQIVNDVSGGLADPNMAAVVADAKVPWVLMHWRSVSAARPHDVPPYRDVVAEVRDELLAAVDAAVHAGVDPAHLIIDPGLGFAKTGEHNWALLRALPEFVDTGIPVLVGASRKRFLGTLLADADGEPRPPDGRETATAVISALAALHGAWGVRVHDVRASVDALKVVEAWTDPGHDG